MDLPARIGRYEIVRLLGQGGMGRVLLAKDSVLGRNVALKILRDDLGLPPESKEALFARMRQEARAAAALEHPHMVTLHDMGEEAPYGLYLVFELVDGPTLRDRITERGRVDLPLVATMARELGAALTAAHEAGVIHRDVKPENVMLSRYGAKLTDFGIARMPDSTLTSAGSVLGTPAYSSPEALALADFSPKSDQFSLAATLYEAISGRRAFQGEDALAIATRVATEPAPPLPLSSGDAGAIVRMDQVLARGLHKEPEKRFASCEELGEALAAAIEMRVSIVDMPRYDTPPPRSIVPRATRRLQNMIAAGALIVIVMLLVLGRHETEGEGVSMRRVATAFASAIAQPRVVAQVPATATSAARHRATGARDAGADADLDSSAPDAHDARDAREASTDATPEP